MQLIHLAADDPRLLSHALPVLLHLRPGLTSEALLEVATSPRGASFLLATRDDDTPLGVAGWRFVADTFTGRKLSVDDLVTDPSARSTGVGTALLTELDEVARRAGCSRLDLDSGVQRFDAHRFYLRERMDITAHHFSPRAQLSRRERDQSSGRTSVRAATRLESRRRR